jgi:tetratricopeptide (TPR) repeat protein
MKKFWKLACLVVCICVIIFVGLVAAGIYYVNTKIITPESKKLSKVHQLRAQNHPDEALALCEEILKEKPDYYPAQRCKGDMLVQLKRYEEALAFYDGITQKNPRHSVAFVAKAEVQAKLKHYNEALSTYESALKADPRNCVAWQGKGDMLIALKNYDEALKAYDEGLAKSEGMT